MKIRIGYLGAPLTLLESFHTMTLKKYHSLGKNKEKELEKIITKNLEILEKIIDYNYKNKILFYRIPHHLFPLLTVKDIDYDIKKHEKICKKIGLKIKKYHMRIDSHPDHYLVLNSLNQEVVENSLRIIKHYKDIFDMLDIDGKIVLHIGSAKPSKEEAIERFKKNFLELDKSLQNLILLENDDKVYTVSDTLCLCEALDVPMVLDCHHFKCHHLKNEKIELLLSRITNTWNNSKLSPKMHFSTPKSKKEKRTHHFYIDYRSFLDFITIIKKEKQDIDIMLECKGKDESLFKLLRQLKFYKPLPLKENILVIDS